MKLSLWKNRSALALLLACSMVFGGCASDDGSKTVSTTDTETVQSDHEQTLQPQEDQPEDTKPEETQPEPSDGLTAPGVQRAPVQAEDMPAYSGSPYAVIHDNEPYFAQEDLIGAAYEHYGDLDSLGRVTLAYASIGQDLMPTEKRGSIEEIHPTGWKQEQYAGIDGGYLYNRCHLIGFQLTSENANTSNLMTGTRYFNVQGMLPFENMVADYVKETSNHVLYRATPLFKGNNLLADGILLEAKSVEDDGEGISFCVFCYNVQPGIHLDYTDGSSYAEDGSSKTQKAAHAESDQTMTVSEDTATYILNTNTKKFHRPDCSSVSKMADHNKESFTGSRDQVIQMGYDPCKKCNP